MFVNHYECPRCDCAWSDAWSCQAADDCPACGLRHISPEEGYEFDDDIEQDRGRVSGPSLTLALPRAVACSLGDTPRRRGIPPVSGSPASPAWRGRFADRTA